jgi:hypothetical protein
MIGVEIESITGDSKYGSSSDDDDDGGGGGGGGDGSDGKGGGGGGNAGGDAGGGVMIVFTVTIHALTPAAIQEKKDAAARAIAAGDFSNVANTHAAEDKALSMAADLGSDRSAMEMLTRKLLNRLCDREQATAMAGEGGNGGGAFAQGSMDDSGAGSRVVATIAEDPDAAKGLSQRFYECLKTVVELVGSLAGCSPPPPKKSIVQSSGVSSLKRT